MRGSFGRDQRRSQFDPKSAEQVAEDPAPRLSGRGRGGRGGVWRRILPTGTSGCESKAEAASERTMSESDRPSTGPGRRGRSSSPSAPPRAERDAEPCAATAAGAASSGAPSSGVVGALRDCDRFRDGASAAPGLVRSVERDRRPRRRRPGSIAARQRIRVGHAVRRLSVVERIALPAEGSGCSGGPPRGGGTSGHPARTRPPPRSGCCPAADPGTISPGSEPRSSGIPNPAGNGRQHVGMIAEILLLVDLVDRIFLIARDPLPPDRRQREEPGLLSLHAPGQADDPGQHDHRQRVGHAPRVRSHPRLVRSRLTWFASEISWAEAVPLLIQRTCLVRSGPLVPSLQRIWRKRGIIRALRK